MAPKNAKCPVRTLVRKASCFSNKQIEMLRTTVISDCLKKKSTFKKLRTDPKSRETNPHTKTEQLLEKFKSVIWEHETKSEVTR